MATIDLVLNVTAKGLLFVWLGICAHEQWGKRSRLMALVSIVFAVLALVAAVDMIV